MAIKMKDFKASVADVLPILMRNEGIHSISHARIVGDGEKITMWAADRFVIVETLLSEGGEHEPFTAYVSAYTLALAKTHHADSRIYCTKDAIFVNAVEYPTKQVDDYPNAEKLLNEVWEDDEYFTLSKDSDKIAGYNIAYIKHIKDVMVIPRINNAQAPTRFFANGRVRGIFQPRKEL